MAVLPSDPTIRSIAWTDWALKVVSHDQVPAAATTPVASVVQFEPPSAE